MSQETSIIYDYDINQVRVFTDREGVKNGILRRLGDVEGLKITPHFFVKRDKETKEVVERRESSWMITIPMEVCRGAEMICKLINPDEKTVMTEAQKAALRAAS
jgi:hypothetical protein